MSLTFEELSTIEIVGSGRARVRCGARGATGANDGRVRARARARGEALARSRAVAVCGARGGSGAHVGRVAARCGARGFAGILPPTPNTGRARAGCSARGDGHSEVFGEGAAHVRAAARGATVANDGRVKVRCRAQGGTAPIFDEAMILLQSPGVLLVASGFVRERVEERIALRGAGLTQILNAINERLVLSTQPRTAIDVLARLRDSIDLVDRVALIWRMLVSEQIAFETAAVPAVETIAAVTDALRLAAGAGSATELHALVAEALALHDVLSLNWRENITESVAFAGALREALIARERLLDRIALASLGTAGVRMVAIVEESFALSDSPIAAVDLLATIHETLELSVTIRLGENVWLAWVVNTDSRAAWTYENYPFNSFAEFNGRYYGIADDGVHLLSGDDDAGADINARVRLGLNNLGTGKMKRMPSAYIALRTTGEMLLKVITTSPAGEKVENWYRLEHRSAAATRETRVKIGRGIKSVEYDFELVNIDGADFDLADFALYPMVLDRRIGGDADG